MTTRVNHQANPATGFWRHVRATLPKPTLYGAYFVAVTVAGLILFVTQAPQLTGNPIILAALIATELALSTMPVRIYGSTTVYVSYVITLVIIAQFGPPAVVLLAPLDALRSRFVKPESEPLRMTAFRAGMHTVVYSSAAFAFGAFSPYARDTVEMSLFEGIAAATITSVLVNAVLLAGHQFLGGGVTPKAFWNKHAWLIPHFVTMGFVGAWLNVAFIDHGLIGVAAFIAPVVIIRVAMKQYVDKTAENVEKLEKQNESLRAANVQIRRISDELRDSYDGTLEALVNALDARDQETKGHSLRVQRYMMDIAREFGVQEGTTQWTDLSRGALLHDVGKIGVSDTILLKPGKLTEDEWTLMRKHPEIGYGMLHQVTFLKGAAEIILAHHERWDGKGYPRGLAHEEVPLGARIFMVCDTFDSMTSDRPYRKALTAIESMNEILKFSGSQFDPQVVEAFLDIYERWVEEREELHAAGVNLLRAA
jgi:putative nucleotidyltransferase with HDIG domain